MRRFVVLSFILSAGCSLDTEGIGTELGDPSDGAFVSDTTSDDTGSLPIDSGSGDSSIVDTGVAPDTAPIDTGMADTSPPDTGPTCDVSACGDPGTAKRVALVDRSKPCPVGFTSTDVVEDRGGNACSCSCGMLSPTCPGLGDLATKYGDTSSCGSTGISVHSNGTDLCSAIGGAGGASISAYFSATAPAPMGGSCGAMPTMDKGPITAQLRVCEPMPGTCVAPICAGAFSECIESPGSCPSTYPQPRTVGADISLTCPPCNCALDSGTCTGSMQLFGKSDCTTKVTTLDVSGACVATGHADDTVNAFKYHPDKVAGAKCTPSFTEGPGLRSTTSPRALCCKS